MALPGNMAVGDTFDRANASSLGTSSTGDAWSQPYGSITINGNAAVRGSTRNSSKPNERLAILDAGSRDVTISATIEKGTSTSYPADDQHIVFWYTDEDHNYAYISTDYVSPSVIYKPMLFIVAAGIPVGQFPDGSINTASYAFDAGTVTVAAAGNKVKVTFTGTWHGYTGTRSETHTYTIAASANANLTGTKIGIGLAGLGIAPLSRHNFADFVATSGDKPMSFYARRTTPDASAALSWRPPAKASWTALANYEVQYKLHTSSTWLGLGDTPFVAPSAISTVHLAAGGYQAGTWIDYRIRALYSDNSRSDWVEYSLAGAEGEITFPLDDQRPGGTTGGSSGGFGSGDIGQGIPTSTDIGVSPIDGTGKVCLTNAAGEALVCGMLPEGTPPNPLVTLRRDGASIWLMYDGKVIITYTIDPVLFPNLFISTTWIGFYDRATGQQVDTPAGGTSSAPPLTGFRYAVFARDLETPLGFHHPLMRRALRWQAYTLLWDETGAISAEIEPVDNAVTAAPKALPGGYQHVVDVTTAQQLLNAGYERWVEVAD